MRDFDSFQTPATDLPKVRPSGMFVLNESAALGDRQNVLASLVLLRTKNRAGTLAHTVHRTEPLGSTTWLRTKTSGPGAHQRQGLASPPPPNP